MSTRVSAEMVSILRSALLTELGTPVAKLDEASLTAGKESHPEWFLGPLAELDRFRAALDAIGWGEPDGQEPVELDLGLHRWAVVQALRMRIEVEREYMRRGRDVTDDEDEFEAAARNAVLIERFVDEHGLGEET